MERNLIPFTKIECRPGIGVRIINDIHYVFGEFGTYRLLNHVTPEWLKNALSANPIGVGFDFIGDGFCPPASKSEADLITEILKNFRDAGQYYLKLQWKAQEPWEGAKQLMQESGTKIKIEEKSESKSGPYSYEVLFAGYDRYEKPFSPDHSDLILQYFHETMINPKTSKIGFKVIRQG